VHRHYRFGECNSFIAGEADFGRDLIDESRFLVNYDNVRTHGCNPSRIAAFAMRRLFLIVKQLRRRYARSTDRQSTDQASMRYSCARAVLGDGVDSGRSAAAARVNLS
jgi:hypothetical protein